MKKFAWVLLASSLTMVGCAQRAPQQVVVVPNNTSTVAIANNAYLPSSLVVSPGQTVVWVNNDKIAHTVSGKHFNSGSIAPGQNYSHQFNQPGTYKYTCKFHPTMHGQIVVK